MPISDKLIDQLLEGNTSPEDILGEDGLLRRLTKAWRNASLKRRWNNISAIQNMT